MSQLGMLGIAAMFVFMRVFYRMRPPVLVAKPVANTGRHKRHQERRSYWSAFRGSV